MDHSGLNKMLQWNETLQWNTQRVRIKEMQKNLGKIKRTVEEYVVLTVATLILVVGVYVFKFPNNFSFGGVTGLAVVLGAVLPTSPGKSYLYH